QHCGPGSPGSDIDAIGAIGSALQLTLDSGVIFGFNQSLLTTAARTKLDEVIAQIPSYPSSKISVAGHTDNQGADDYNMQLSLQRAQAVSDYISRHLSQSQVAIEAIGYGEESPIADNDSESGQQKNRRVEIIVMPVSGQTR
nr:OmpA family protein [Gammaproteobacteria bacterium]